MDLERLTPVEQTARRRRRIWRLVLVLLILAGVYYFVFRRTYVIAYDKPEQHFAHGSIGSESVNGLPYWVFKALPELYKDELGPEGYGRFGFVYAHEGDDLPIGFSKRIVQGVQRVWLNCAVCHVGTYRTSPEAAPTIVYGAPSNNLRLYEFIQFLRRVAVDPRFNADNIVAAINSPAVGGNVGVVGAAFYRHLVVDRVRTGLLAIRDQLAFMDRQQDWGPGRVDTFNPYKAILFNFPMDEGHISDVELNGASDYPAIWQQRPRQGMFLHWDGNNPSVDERNLSAALGAGVTPVSVDRERIARIKAWTWTLEPPAYPRPDEVDARLADRGRELFAGTCADCHGIGGTQGYDYDTATHTRLGRVEDLGDIGTDPGRWASYTEHFAAAQNLAYAGYPWRFHNFRKTRGYANQPVDGIWARSPYLHNGSVPTLRDLLEPAAKRPQRWYRGSDVFDFTKVGYRSDGRGESRDALFEFDTAKPGNSNAGHEGARYGTDLSASDKDALVEYMKTL